MEGSDKFGRKYGCIIRPLVILEVTSKQGISLSNVQGFLRTLYSQVHCNQMVMWASTSLLHHSYTLMISSAPLSVSGKGLLLATPSKINPGL